MKKRATLEALRTERLLNDLASLYLEGNPYLSEYAWHWEVERWHEMLSCNLIVCGVDPAKARDAVRVLADLQLDTPEAMLERLTTGKPSVKSVLKGVGIAPKLLTKSLASIRVLAGVCQRSWAGSPQKFLRKQGTAAIAALSKKLRTGGMKGEQASLLATLWLQNVSNVPVLASNVPKVAAFCKRYRLTPAQVESAADRAGINVAIIDELIQMSSVRR